MSIITNNLSSQQYYYTNAFTTTPSGITFNTNGITIDDLRTSSAINTSSCYTTIATDSITKDNNNNDISSYYALAQENKKLKEENEKLKGELKMKKEEAIKTFKTNADTFSTSYNINDDFYDFFKKYYSTNVLHPNEFSQVEEIVPNKVYRFTFNDKTVIKTICDKSDTFDLEYAFYLALAKKLYKKIYTFEGILYIIDNEMRFQKEYIKIVQRGIKLFNKQKAEQAKAEAEEKQRKEQHRKYVEKKQRRDERRKAGVQEELISVIQTAIERSKDF